MPSQSFETQYIPNALAQAVGKAFTFSANILVFILVARLGGAELFGQYSYVLNYLAIAGMTADFGMTSVLAKDLAQAGDSAPVYFGNFLFLRMLSCAVTAALAIPLAWWVCPEFFWVITVACLLLPLIASRFFEPVYQVYCRPWYATLPSVAFAAANLGLTLLVFQVRPSLDAIILAFILANGVYAAVAAWLSWRLLVPKFRIQARVLRKIMKLGAPIGVSSLFTLVNGRAAIFLLEGMLSTHAVAMYNAAFKLFDMATLLLVMVVTPLLPIFSSKLLTARKELHRLLRAMNEMGAVVFLPVALGMPLAADFIIGLLYGPEFAEAAPVLSVLAWNGFLVYYALFFSTIAIAIGVVHYEYWNTGIPAVASIVLNFLLIPRYGIQGSALILLGCEVFMVSVSIFYVTKNFGNLFRAKAWARILLCGAVFLALSRGLALVLPWWAALGLALAAYAALCWSLGLVRGNLRHLAVLREARQ